jgi:hypothetical protein
MHYCDGCNDDRNPHDPTWCCGGDVACPDWEDEPDCPDAEDGAHAWSEAYVEFSTGLLYCGEAYVESLGGTAYRATAVCKRCGMTEVVEDPGWQRDPGECDRRTYTAGKRTPCRALYCSASTADPEAAGWYATDGDWYCPECADRRGLRDRETDG